MKQPVALAARRTVMSIITFLTVLVSTTVPALAVIAAVLVWLFPKHMKARALAKLRKEMQSAWPHLLDNLIGAVHAGQPLVFALADAADKTPEPLRTALRAMAFDIRATGNIQGSLAELARTLNDPIGDRVVLALRTIDQVGGSDAATLLTGVAMNVRADLAHRGEIEARRTWITMSAQLAVTAPWVTVLALASRHDAMAAYASRPGTVLLLGAATACLIAYRWMLALGRLPDANRVIRT